MILLFIFMLGLRLNEAYSSGTQFQRQMSCKIDRHLIWQSIDRIWLVAGKKFISGLCGIGSCSRKDVIIDAGCFTIGDFPEIGFGRSRTEHGDLDVVATQFFS